MRKEGRAPGGGEGGSNDVGRKSILARGTGKCKVPEATTVPDLLKKKKKKSGKLKRKLSENGQEEVRWGER